MTLVRGLVLQVTETGSRTYYFRYRTKARTQKGEEAAWKRIADVADISLADARAIAAGYRAGLANGRGPILEEQKAIAAARRVQNRPDSSDLESDS